MAEEERAAQRSTQVARPSQGMISLESGSVDSERHTTVKGSVYLIVNDLIQSRVKIGYTTRDPIERASELVTTGTTGTFVVIYQALVLNPYAVEQEVHRRLRDRNRGLEWFEVCPNRVKELIHEVAGEVLYEDTTPRWHRSQPEPSNETKQLLREAKQAADERRRLEEEAAQRERLAAEQARIEAARALAEQQRIAEEEEYRRLAEEQARTAAIEEEKRRAHEAVEERKRRQQELIEENRRRAQAERARLMAEAKRLNEVAWQNCVWFGTRISPWILLATCLYLAFGPYSPRQMQRQESAVVTLEAAVSRLQRQLDLIEQRRVHQQSRAMLFQDVTDRKRRFEDARTRLTPSEVVVHKRRWEEAANAYGDWVVVDVRLENAIAELTKAEVTGQVAVGQTDAVTQELETKKNALVQEQKALSEMKAHNSRFPWLQTRN